MANILITGATGGFGALIVQELIASGHKVVGTSRKVNATSSSDAYQLVEMDVTNEGSVNCGVDAALSSMGNIDVLINSAGVGCLGWTEAFSAEEMKKIFEVNVFGVQRVTRAVIPQMREQGRGLIINVSSLLGRITIPFYGPYNSSKWALEGLTENYRSELSQLGIEVCLVEPGGYQTAFIENLVRPADETRIRSYGPMAEAPKAFLEQFESVLASTPVQDPILVGKAVAELVNTPHGQRQFRTVVDKLGMGDPIAGYNENFAQLTTGIYQNFGIGHLLKVAS